MTKKKLSAKLNNVPSDTVHLKYGTRTFSHSRLATECGSVAGAQTTPTTLGCWAPFLVVFYLSSFEL